MSTQHTAGPWKALSPLGEGDYGVLSQNVNASGNFYVATLPNGAHEEAAANARIMAASPDMLAALEMLVNAFIHKEGDTKGNQARTNIFKHCSDMAAAATAADRAIRNAKGGTA